MPVDPPKGHALPDTTPRTKLLGAVEDTFSESHVYRIRPADEPHNQRPDELINISESVLGESEDRVTPKNQGLKLKGTTRSSEPINLEPKQKHLSSL